LNVQVRGRRRGLTNQSRYHSRCRQAADRAGPKTAAFNRLQMKNSLEIRVCRAKLRFLAQYRLNRLQAPMPKTTNSLKTLYLMKL
jgi:hypothetical protein